MIDFHDSSDGSGCLQCGKPRFILWVGKISWRRKWQPIPVFLPGKSHGQRSLVGYSPWGHKESDMTSLSLSLRWSYRVFFIFYYGMLMSFPMSQLFTWGGQSIGVSASASILPMNTQDWPPLGWTGWISLQSKGLSRVFSTPQFKSINFFGAQLSSQSNCHIHTWPLEKP